jgi:hypothetical protein
MCKRIMGRMREAKVTDMELNWLYSTLFAANRPLIHYDQPMVLRGNIGIERYWFGVLPLYVRHLFKAGDYKESRIAFTRDPSRI